jgi:trimeric autotransporter adhesin
MRNIILLIALVFTFYQTSFTQNTWTTFGTGFNHEIYCFAEYQGNLIVGGTFDTVGGSVIKRIAKWNGTAWSGLGSGITGGLLGIGTVRALTVYNGELIAGGYFKIAGGDSVNYIAKWNGTAWSPLGSGMSGAAPYVEALAVFNNELYAGGTFDSSGGVKTNGIAKWNGTGWSAIGTGLSPNYGVYALYVFYNYLYIGGGYTTINGVTANNISSYNGSVFSPIGGGVKGGYVKTIGSYNTDILIGGQFDTVGFILAKNIARWNGVFWYPYGSGMNGAVYAFASYKNELISGGYFTTAGGVTVNYAARWNNYSWQKLDPGTGVNNYVTCLNLYPSASPGLILGGYFTTAGSVPANRIVRWDNLVQLANKNDKTPNEFRLMQNYPNPFNPSTTIQFEISKSSKVNLTVYDELGQTVSVLVDENLNAGTYNISVDLSNHSSGNYYYVLTSGDYRETKKMALVK